MIRLVIGALWLCAGTYGVYTFLKHRMYVEHLPSSQGNDKLKRSFRTRFLWALAFTVLGIWWVLTYRFPRLSIR